MTSPNRRTPKKLGGVRTIALATLAIALIVVAGVWATSNGEPSANAILAADLHRVQSTDFEITVVANGELEAKKQTEIRSELESRSTIVELVDEGVRVKKGDLLVRLNSETIENEIAEETLRVESARSELIAAEAAYDIQLSDNESALSQAKLKLELAEIELTKWLQGDLKKKQDELKLAIENGARRLEQAEEKFKDSERLEPMGFVSRDELREDEIKFEEAKAAYQTAQLNQDVYETYERVQKEKTLRSDVEQAKAELLRVERSNASRLANKEADRTNRRRQLALREEKLEKLQKQFEACTVHAPTDGLVVYGSTVENNRWNNDGPLDVGKEVHPNQLLIVLPDISEMVASVRVHESYAGRIQPGMRATVRCDAAQGLTFDGSVASIGVLAESGGWRDPNLREYTVKIDLGQSGDDSKLKPSMRAEARIILGEVTGTLAVPVQAVFREGRTSFVYTPRSGGKYARTEVDVGRRSSAFAQIVSGLKQGDTVLLREPGPGEIFRTKQDPDVSPGSTVADSERPARAQTRPVSDAAQDSADSSASRGEKPGARQNNAGE